MRVYYDSEFLEDGQRIHLISIGMVRDGAEYYAVSRDMPVRRIRRNPWLMQNVVPALPKAPGGMPKRWLFDYGAASVKPRTQIAREVRDFVTGTPDPELWAWYGASDYVALYQLWGRLIDLPEGVPMWTNELKQEAQRLGNPDLPEMPGTTAHNALHDAREVKYRHEWLLAQAGDQQAPARRKTGRVPPPRSA